MPSGYFLTSLALSDIQKTTQLCFEILLLVSHFRVLMS